MIGQIMIIPLYMYYDFLSYKEEIQKKEGVFMTEQQFFNRLLAVYNFHRKEEE